MAKKKVVRPSDSLPSLQEQYPLPPGCTMRPSRDGDEDGLLDLLLAAFDGVWPRRRISVPPIDHLRWKLRSHEVAVQGHLLVELDGRIIGCRSMWVTHLKVDDRVFLTRLPIDRAVLPDMQRHHVMSAMETRTPPEWFDQFGVIVGLSNNWQSNNFISGTPHRRSVDVVARRLEGDATAAPVGEWSIRRVDAFDDRVDALWRDAASGFRLAFVRTKDSLNYRYADPRAGDYSIAIAEAGDRVLGYIIYTSWKQTGQVADVLVLPERFDVLESLLAYALDQLRQTGCASVECWRDIYHPYGPVLDKLGFDHVRRRQGITVHWLRGPDELAFFADPKSAVHIMAGDTDLV
jgi:hypothetical protein